MNFYISRVYRPLVLIQQESLPSIQVNKHMDTIPLRDHPFWPLLLHAGFASSADNPVPRKWGLPIKPPDAHDVYVFETTQGKTITWYCRSDLLVVDGALYFVYYDYELLSKYSSSLASSQRAEYLLVKNTPLTASILPNGVLRIQGQGIYSAKCLRMRPMVPWYTVGFQEDLERIYSKQDQFTEKIHVLQRWARKSIKHHKRDVLLALRNVGWFGLLDDDVFNIIINEALKVFQIRQHQREFELVHQDDPK